MFLGPRAVLVKQKFSDCLLAALCGMTFPMPPLVRLALAVAGFAALAASLPPRKRAGWFALVGAAALLGLAVADSDPVLALGGAALCLARFFPVAPGKGPTRPPEVGAAPIPPVSDTGQAP